jgi:hypothetical protein
MVKRRSVSLTGVSREGRMILFSASRRLLRRQGIVGEAYRREVERIRLDLDLGSPETPVNRAFQTLT